MQNLLYPWQRNYDSEEIKNHAKELLSILGKEKPFWIRPEKYFAMLDDLNRLKEGLSPYFTEFEKKKIKEKTDLFFKNIIKIKEKKDYYEYENYRFPKKIFNYDDILLFLMKLCRKFGMKKVSEKKMKAHQKKKVIDFSKDNAIDLIVFHLLGFKETYYIYKRNKEIIEFLKLNNIDVQFFNRKNLKDIIENIDLGLIKIDFNNNEFNLSIFFDLKNQIKKNKPFIVAYVDKNNEAFLNTAKILKNLRKDYFIKLIDLNLLDPLFYKAIIAL